MSQVFFAPVDSYANTDQIRVAALRLLHTVLEREGISLAPFVPLKVHFGEKGNTTFIEPKNFEGIIDYLDKQHVESAFMDTNVLYRGERMRQDTHVKLAREHGFTQRPVVIADGEYGEDFLSVEIGQKHFNACKIAGAIAREQQMIVFSHFKGHMLTGFGGAIKHLAMGCASKGGKLDQHANAIPRVSYLRCKGCRVCADHCPESAIEVRKKARIHKNQCVGCAACVSVCPYKAISSSWMASVSRSFGERLVEYAYGAVQGKTVIYITFVMNVTRGCDCEGRRMQPIAKDVGLLASVDPVAIDQAALDVLDSVNQRTVFRRGRRALVYAERIGLGERTYVLEEIALS